VTRDSGAFVFVRLGPGLGRREGGFFGGGGFVEVLQEAGEVGGIHAGLVLHLPFGLGVERGSGHGGRGFGDAGFGGLVGGEILVEAFQKAAKVRGI